MEDLVMMAKTEKYPAAPPETDKDCIEVCCWRHKQIDWYRSK